ncbi:MAG: hypothetical protein C3F14_11070, partial [Deltaproteobacteria bacterium]
MLRPVPARAGRNRRCGGTGVFPAAGAGSSGGLLGHAGGRGGDRDGGPPRFPEAPEGTDQIDAVPRRILLDINVIVTGVLVVLAAALGIVVVVLLTKKRTAEDLARASASKAEEVLQKARKEAENILKESTLQAKDYQLQVKLDFERETRDRKNEISQLEKRLLQKEDLLDRKTDALETRALEFGRKEKELADLSKKLEGQQAELQDTLRKARENLERIAGVTAEQAKNELVEMVADEARLEAGKKIRSMDEEFKEEASQKARKMISLAVQRYAADYVAEHVVTAVPLPSEEMKGRIIGREGRNIRAFEAATGIDVIIDDTPEAVILSGFNPVRREVARIALTRLVQDGRIHPARIEETVEKVAKEVEETIREAGEQALFDLGIHGVHADLVKLIGRLKYRTSYGQNIYT